MNFAIVRCCSADAFDAIPQGVINVDVGKALIGLSSKGWRTVADAGVMCVVEKDGAEATLYSSGRVLVKTPDRSVADAVSQEIYEDAGI